MQACVAPFSCHVPMGGAHASTEIFRIAANGCQNAISPSKRLLSTVALSHDTLEIETAGNDHCKHAQGVSENRH